MLLSNLKKILAYLIPYKFKLVIGFLLLSIAAYIVMKVPYFFKMSIDELNTVSINFNKLFKYLFIILILMILKGILLFYARSILIGLSRVIENKMRNNLVFHLMRLPLSFYDKNKTGDLMSRITQDLEYVRWIIGPSVMHTLNVFLLLFFAMINIALINWKVALYLILLFVFLLFILKIIGARYYYRSKKIQEALSEISSFVSESLQGIRVIKTYVKEKLINQAFNEINIKYFHKNLQLSKLSGLFRPVLYFIVGVCSVTIIWVGGEKVMKNELSLGTLISLLAYIDILSGPVMIMSFVSIQVNRGISAYSRIESILKIPIEINDNKAISNIKFIKGNIESKNLTFKYSDKRFFALKKLNFRIENGEKVAIIGPTGSGKSTLVSLILRLYFSPNNSLFVGDFPIEKIPIKVLRSNIALVPQESILFPETIYHNICFGIDKLAEINHVMKMTNLACLNEQVLAFPDGYNEWIGEGGVTLSGGQKQRLSIGRALISSANILIFDDSFSNVDSNTENKILKNIYKYFSHCTILIITHRISIIKKSDKIISLNAGQIEEIGTPKELSKSGGYYTRLLCEENYVI